MGNRMSKPMQHCSVIIKTHNSERYLAKAVASLKSQTRLPDQIIIVDSASKHPEYLKPFQQDPRIKVIVERADIGFCRGNNLGVDYAIKQSDFILFLNPDAFLTPTFIEQALRVMNESANQDVAILTGALLGYDIEADQPTGRYDSTGVFRKWYGQWYDRYQGLATSQIHLQSTEEVPAICGALMFCRTQALKKVLLRDREVFDNTFYMYKEDIDLSLRLKKAGWRLLFDPRLAAYHCRGWNADRTKMPRQYRLYSAKNELRIHMRYPSPCVVYSLAKYLSVRFLNL